MSILNINDSQFETEVVNSEKTVLVDFWAEWCGPCKALGPKLEEISGELAESVKIIKINIDENKETAQKFGIRSIPTMIIFKEGKDVDTLMGNLPKEEILGKLTAQI
ncbi:MAG: thioredoxin [Bdellovibrionales bacterium]